MPFEDLNSVTVQTPQNRPLPRRGAATQAIGVVRKLCSFPVLMGALLAAVTVGNLFLGLKAAASAPPGTARYCVFEGDTWWHVSVGEHILSTHKWPTTDIYSFTAHGDPWIADEWLGEVVMALSNRVDGLSGLTILDVSFAASIILLIYGYSYVKSRNSKAAFIACAVALPLVIVFSDLRPQLLGYIFLLITLISLESFRQGRLKKLWFLPFVFLLWVNTHGTFALGLGIVGLYWVSGMVKARIGGIKSQLWTTEQRRHLGIISLLSLLAITITPYGTRLAAFPLHMELFQPLTMATFQEWKPVDFSGPYGEYFLIVLLLILAAQVVVRLEYRLEELGLLLLAVYGACVHTRLMIFFTMIASGFLASAIAQYMPRYNPGKDRRFLNAALMALIVFGCVEIFPSRQELKQVVSHGFPTKAVEYIKQHPSVEPVFDKEFWGGYLIKELGPKQKVFIDGRGGLYEPAGVLSDYLSIMSLAPNTMFLLRKYHVRSCLIERSSPLATLLSHSPGWHKVYSGQNSVIFMHTTKTSARGEREKVGGSTT